jgi:hypothetical protein
VLRDGFVQQLTRSKTASPMDWQDWTWHKLKKHKKSNQVPNNFHR